MNSTQDNIFRVDKKRVIFSFLRWQIALIVGLLLLHDNLNISKTLTDPQFWWLTVMVLVLGVVFDFWEISHGKIKFEGNKIIDYSDDKNGIDLNEFSEIKKAKTVYGSCLGLEYKVPKGNKARVLFQYNFYSTPILQQILKEIKRITPQIELDDTAKQMLAGTFNNRL